MRTIEELTEFLEVPPQRMIKTLIYCAGDRAVAVVLRGDRSLNEVKLARLLGRGSGPGRRRDHRAA